MSKSDPLYWRTFPRSELEKIFTAWLLKKHNGILPVFQDIESARSWCFEGHKEIFIGLTRPLNEDAVFEKIGKFMMKKVKDVYNP